MGATATASATGLATGTATCTATAVATAAEIADAGMNGECTVPRCPNPQKATPLRVMM